MARKLKIDRVLFTATLLLICVSVVMVYSASAVVALERFQQPYLFLTKQALWSVLGLAVLVVAMRVDYRTYRNEPFIWSLLGVVFLMLVAVAIRFRMYVTGQINMAAGESAPDVSDSAPGERL